MSQVKRKRVVDTTPYWRHDQLYKTYTDDNGNKISKRAHRKGKKREADGKTYSLKDWRARKAGTMKTLGNGVEVSYDDYRRLKRNMRNRLRKQSKVNSLYDKLVSFGGKKRGSRGLGAYSFSLKKVKNFNYDNPEHRMLFYDEATGPDKMRMFRFKIKKPKFSKKEKINGKWTTTKKYYNNRKEYQADLALWKKYRNYQIEKKGKYNMINGKWKKIKRAASPAL